MRFQAGQLVAGRYQVIRPIATGGGAEIYQVHDNIRLTTVALKLLRPELTRDPEFINRFKDEAAALAKLNHPNIVRFYDYVQLESLVFIVMDFVEGTNLRKKIKNQQGKIPLEEISEIFRSVCSGLHYAHQQGIVHCDIKPENILIDVAGKILLSDFGIASFTGMREMLPGGIGTPAYMAPEQIMNKQVTPQTDIYALGIMLYEMITGVKPFNGNSVNNDLPVDDRIKWEQVNQTPTPPIYLSNVISPDLNATIMQCLEKEPHRRFPDINSFFDTFERSIQQRITRVAPDFIDEKPSVEKESRTRAKNTKAAIPILIILFAVAIVMVFAFAGNPGSSPVSTSQALEKLPKTFTYPNTCMEIVITTSPLRKLSECVQSITVAQDNTLQVTVEWKAMIQDQNDFITVGADTENKNMYLVDDLGNRLEHIATGGGANQNVDLYNGQSKIGWFIFPEADQNASFFQFVDDDNGVRSPKLDREW